MPAGDLPQVRQGLVDRLRSPCRAGAGRGATDRPVHVPTSPAKGRAEPARRPLTRAGHPGARHTLVPAMTTTKTYDVRTHGCQMNVHDSERLAGLLEAAGYLDWPASRPTAAPTPPTSSSSTPAQCGRTPTTGSTATWASCGRPSCGTPPCRSPSAAASPRRTVPPSCDRAPWVDVVFGTHNIGSLPALLDRARHNGAAAGRDPRQPRDLPVDPADPPRVGLLRLGLDLGGLQQHLHVLHRPVAARHRGGPPSRRRPRRGPGAGRRGRPRGHAARAERQHLRGGVRRPAGLRQAAARLRGDRRAGAGPVHQPAPRDFTPDVIAAMAETPNVMPSLHMPLQSGSDAVLRAMRRSYRGARYLDIIDEVRGASPTRRSPPTSSSASPARPRPTSRAPSTSSRRLASRARSRSSTRPARAHRPPTMAEQVPKAVVQERYERLVALQEEIPGGETGLWKAARSRLSSPRGGPQGRRDPAPLRPGAGQPARALHAPARPPAPDAPRPGDLVTVEVTYGAPHHLVADSALRGGPYSVRRTAGGEAWSAEQAPDASRPPLVSLGMPSRGRPRAPAGLPGRC